MPSSHIIIGERKIRRGMWSLCSPSLFQCGIYLWGILKEPKYSNNPRTEDDLKESISTYIVNVFTSRTLICNKCVLLKWHVSVSWRSPASSLDVMNTNTIHIICKNFQLQHGGPDSWQTATVAITVPPIAVKHPERTVMKIIFLICALWYNC